MVFFHIFKKQNLGVEILTQVPKIPNISPLTIGYLYLVIN